MTRETAADVKERYDAGRIIDRVYVCDAVLSYRSVMDANRELQHLTGIRDFFPDKESFNSFPKILAGLGAGVSPRNVREWGDFQTPPALAERVCGLLSEVGCSPEIIIEPSYGVGNFIFAALRAFPSAELIYGVEIQERYEWQFKIAMLIEALLGKPHAARIALQRGSIFTHRFPEEILNAQELLIVGNPPWVTNAELGGMRSDNLPAKRNIKALNGLDALTGKSNFDVCEYILLQMIELLSGRRGTLAMLCKNSVVKNIVEALPKLGVEVTEIRQLEIDAKLEFGASVEASLLLLTTGGRASTATCKVSSLNSPDRVTRVFGWAKDRFVSNLEDYEANFELDGESPFTWRQGLKHDCSQIMELEANDGTNVNGLGEIVDVEGDRLYWLLKSSDLRTFEVSRARKKVVVTQRQIGEDTSTLKESAAKLWGYLRRHEGYFEKRKSSIYRNKPAFSIFGVGGYAFAPYKVAISGMYKEPRFALVLPIDGRPVMLDDTCYYLGFESYGDALFTATLLNSTRVRRLLQSIVFTDAKRPYTKEVLMRIGLVNAVRLISFEETEQVWKAAAYRPRESVGEKDYQQFRECLERSQGGLPFNR